MDNKTQEQIAIGASVTANCAPCFKFHFAKAREEGAYNDDIQEAARVGRMRHYG
jgi:AhpD family alkylhydroperoxidase